MAISRSARITILLVIDVFFFFTELIVGYAVGSLALVADSFHMLNDVMSLIVALYAIKLTAKNPTDSRYSYGWHRAEILAALINGVFLLALCFSISLEALERFFSTPEISNPKLVVIVGSLGLASNVVGLFLFHEHGHSHGHSHSTPASATNSKAPSIVAPIAVRAEHSPNHPISVPKSPTKASRHSRSDSFSSLYGHPVATRASLVHAAQEIAHAGSPPPRRQNSVSFRPSVDHMDEVLEPEELRPYSPELPLSANRRQSCEESPLLSSSERIPSPSPSQDNKHGEHSHSHAGSMNMRALVLHVLGDALGNVGVIATGLIIWLTEWSFKYYCDPVISLLITVIIFSSALPLVRSASFILLQAAPSTVSVKEFEMPSLVLMVSYPCTNCISGNSPNRKSSLQSTLWLRESTISCPLLRRYGRCFTITEYIQAQYSLNTIIRGMHHRRRL